MHSLLKQELSEIEDDQLLDLLGCISDEVSIRSRRQLEKHGLGSGAELRKIVQEAFKASATADQR